MGGTGCREGGGGGESSRSKNEKFVFIVTGIFADYNVQVTAAAYIDASCTHKQDEGGTESIKMKGKIVAGMQANETFGVILS